MKNKVAGFIISGIVSGAVGSQAYVNLSGQFHSNDVAMINLGVAVAAAAVTGAVVGGTVNGSLTTLSGGSFKSGFIQGAMAGAVAGGLAGAYAGYGATSGGAIEDSVSTQMSSQGDPVNVSIYNLKRLSYEAVKCAGATAIIGLAASGLGKTITAAAPTFGHPLAIAAAVVVGGILEYGSVAGAGYIIGGKCF